MDSLGSWMEQLQMLVARLLEYGVEADLDNWLESRTISAEEVGHGY